MNPTEFDACFDKLLGNEGGYVSPQEAAARCDPGGETNWGVCKRSYPNEDISKLTQDRAKQIYLADFWNACHASMLPPEARFDVFDGAVNSGVTQSLKWLQQAVDVEPDGVIGPATLAAIGKLPGAVISARFNGYRLRFMCGLKNWPQSSRGWAKRIASNLIGA